MSTLSKEQIETMVGGPIVIRLIEPTAYGRLPLWEAEIPTWPSIDPVQFRANEDGTLTGLLIAAAKALHKWQMDNVVEYA